MKFVRPPSASKAFKVNERIKNNNNYCITGDQNR